VKAEIQKAVAAEDQTLYLTLNNGNELTLDVKQLFGCPRFAPLVDKSLWKTMRVRENSLLWGNEKTAVERSIDTILNYFA